MPLALLVPAFGCGDSPSTPIGPTAPPLSLTCPASVTINSPTGSPIPVTYGTPISTGGSPPVTTDCTPINGSTFNPGATTVTCTATDAKNATQPCSFTVTVTVPATLSLTQFIAFGDSITAGEVPSEGFGFHGLRIDLALAYPTDLTNMLISRYTAQTASISVANKGVQGETDSLGFERLQGIPLNSTQALLLMEGSNDVTDDPSSIGPPLVDMNRMVAYAKPRVGRLYLATIAPQSSNVYSGCPARNGGRLNVPTYNNGIRGIAANFGVTLVDVEAALSGNLSLYIDCDGLHPTPQGYSVIANTFFESIKQTLELKTTALPNPTTMRPSVSVPRAQRTAPHRN